MAAEEQYAEKDTCAVMRGWRTTTGSNCGRLQPTRRGISHFKTEQIKVPAVCLAWSGSVIFLTLI